MCWVPFHIVVCIEVLDAVWRVVDVEQHANRTGRKVLQEMHSGWSTVVRLEDVVHFTERRRHPFASDNPVIPNCVLPLAIHASPSA